MEYPESQFPPAMLLKIAAASLSPSLSISLPNGVPKVFETFPIMLPPPPLPPLPPLPPPIEELPNKLLNLLLQKVLHDIILIIIENNIKIKTVICSFYIIFNIFYHKKFYYFINKNQLKNYMDLVIRIIMKIPVKKAQLTEFLSVFSSDSGKISAKVKYIIAPAAKPSPNGIVNLI